MTDLKIHQLINQDSGEIEWFTPAVIIEAAREAMGGIDLDPASCEKANTIVKATYFFDQEQDGLERNWGLFGIGGSVWLNHPFSRNRNYYWIKKLLDEFKAGNFRESCNITYAATSEEWFRPLLSYPQCFLHGRTAYIDSKTMLPQRDVPKGSVVTYLGPKGKTRDFFNAFNKLGTVKVAYE